MAERPPIGPKGEEGSGGRQPADSGNGQAPSRNTDADFPLDLRLSSDPWRKAPTEELQDQVLPRWFVLLAIGAVLAAIVTLAVAFGAFGPGEVPVAERRPPPASGLTHDVGDFETGPTDPVAYDGACPLLEGVRVAGTPTDRASLRRGLAAACNVAEGDAAGALESFADAGGVVRFAVFETTGVDSAATTDGEPPQVLVNARFSRSAPQLIAPLVIHDAIARTDPGDARTELSARIAEADACSRLFDEPPRSCSDALSLSTSPDALAALRAVGYE